MIGTSQPEVLTKFYEAVFEKPVNEMMGWMVGGVYFGVLEHSEVKGKNQEGPRIMFNLETSDVRGEFERISKVDGAEVIKEPYQMTMEGEVVAKDEEKDDGFWIATIADPDRNYFQLMTPWEETETSKGNGKSN